MVNNKKSFKFCSFFLFLIIFLYNNQTLNSKQINQKDKLILKANFKKNQINKKQTKIVKKTLIYNSKNTHKSIKPSFSHLNNTQSTSLKNHNLNIFHLNGRKFIYEKEKSPTDYKLNNFCFLAVDGQSGDVLFAKSPGEKCYPASLTKLMTLYILFEELSKRNLKMNSRIYFSHSASMKQRMKLGIQPGDSISVLEAIQALIILSANDVAAAVGEKIAGSEKVFGSIMTKKAKELCMKSTNFYNASGLFHPDQQTTAIDLIKLGIAIKRDFPEYYHFFSKTSFEFRNRTISGHNDITKNYYGAEGLKTGFVKASGFNIVSSATRNGKTVFAAILGANSKFERDEYMKNLLDQSFEKLSFSKKRYNKGENYNNNYDKLPFYGDAKVQLVSFSEKNQKRVFISH